MKLKENIAISESGYLFNPSTGESFIVNPLGMEVLQLVKKGRSFGDISKEILSHYSVDTITFEKDYNDFIHQLRQYLLIGSDE
ncbi:MAG TPA: PqqD family protein [Bacteroidales bacterium]|nr:PqqD family protein [Bacteroidales bacterium]HNS45672.1 PqqD family protein [Bacteroidales bacterium]